MNNRVFSKIWILIVFIILIGSGVLVYQYLSVPEEQGEMSEEKTEEKIEEEKIGEEKIGEETTEEEKTEEEKTKEETDKQVKVEKFKLNFGQTKSIEAEGLKIKFVNVTEDFRCPADVQCITAGQVTIVINVIKDEQNLGDFSLTKGRNEYLAIDFNGYLMKLIVVDPYPKVEKEIELSDYVITLSIFNSVE